jgi:hypothetical protein
MIVADSAGSSKRSTDLIMKVADHEKHPQTLMPAAGKLRALGTNSEKACQRTTLPALRQEVQTLSLLVLPPPAAALTVWMLGFHRRLVRRWEWDTDIPKPGPLPQTSHTLATETLLKVQRKIARQRATWELYTGLSS